MTERRSAAAVGTRNTINAERDRNAACTSATVRLQRDTLSNYGRTGDFPKCKGSPEPAILKAPQLTERGKLHGRIF